MSRVQSARSTSKGAAYPPRSRTPVRVYQSPARTPTRGTYKSPARVTRYNSPARPRPVETVKRPVADRPPPPTRRASVKRQPVQPTTAFKEYDDLDRAPEDRALMPPRGGLERYEWVHKLRRNGFSVHDPITHGVFIMEGVNYSRLECIKDTVRGAEFTKAVKADIVSEVGNGVQPEDVAVSFFPGQIKTVVLHYNQDDPRAAPTGNPELVDAEWSIKCEYMIRSRDVQRQQNVAMAMYTALTSLDYTGEQTRLTYKRLLDPMVDVQALRFVRQKAEETQAPAMPPQQVMQQQQQRPTFTSPFRTRQIAGAAPQYPAAIEPPAPPPAYEPPMPLPEPPQAMPQPQPHPLPLQEYHMPLAMPVAQAPPPAYAPLPQPAPASVMPPRSLRAAEPLLQHTAPAPASMVPLSVQPHSLLPPPSAVPHSHIPQASNAPSYAMPSNTTPQPSRRPATRSVVPQAPVPYHVGTGGYVSPSPPRQDHKVFVSEDVPLARQQTRFLEPPLTAANSWASSADATATATATAAGTASAFGHAAASVRTPRHGVSTSYNPMSVGPSMRQQSLSMPVDGSRTAPMAEASAVAGVLASVAPSQHGSMARGSLARDHSMSAATAPTAEEILEKDRQLQSLQHEIDKERRALRTLSTHQSVASYASARDAVFSDPRKPQQSMVSVSKYTPHPSATPTTAWQSSYPVKATQEF